MAKTCSPLNSKMVDSNLLFVDSTVGERVNIVHEKTKVNGAPTCIKISNNYKTVFIANTTGMNIPFCDGQYFVDTEGNVKNYFPVFSALTLSLSNEGYWQQVTNDGGTSTEIPNTKTDTPAIELNLSGPLNRNIAAVLNVSPDANNAIQIRGNGVFAEQSADVPNDKIDTPAITVNLSGTLNRNIEADLNVSSDADNAVEIRPDGVYVPASTGGGAFTGDV